MRYSSHSYLTSVCSFSSHFLCRIVTFFSDFRNNFVIILAILLWSYVVAVSLIYNLETINTRNASTIGRSNVQCSILTVSQLFLVHLLSLRIIRYWYSICEDSNFERCE